MAKTKMTFKAHSELWDKFSRMMDSHFIRRDGFLNHVLGIETSQIEMELNGLKLSQSVKDYISSNFKAMKTIQVSIQLDDSVAERFNAVIKEHNLVRDSVLNRLLMYLWSADGFLDEIEVPRTIVDIEDLDETPTSPVKAITELINDPMKAIRKYKEDEDNLGIYNSLDLRQKYPGFIVYMEEVYLPENIDSLIDFL